MSSAYYPDGSGWACYVDNNGQPQYLVDSAGNHVKYNEVVQSSSGSKSDSGKSDKSDKSRRSGDSKGSKHSSSSKNSKHSGHSRHSDNSEASKHSKASDSGQSSNTPATVGWECNWCRTANYTDHLMIPFMSPRVDLHGNVVRDANGNLAFEEYPYIPCGGCNGACNPYCSALFDP